MFDNNNSDEDFDFDLDEVVRLHSQPVNAGLVAQNGNKDATSNEKSKELTQKPTQSVGEGWPNEDDSHLLKSLLEPEASKNSVFQSQPHKSNQHLKAIDLQQNMIDNSKNFKHSSNTLVYNEKSAYQSMEIAKAKFPGPAGFLNLPSSNNNNRGQRPKINKNLTNVDGLGWWEMALSSLNVKSTWESKEMNLQTIKKNFAPHSISFTAPLLIVGVQKIDFLPVITDDVNCVLQDPTSEVNGIISKNIIADYGNLIQVGAILVLHQPSAMRDCITSKCIVTITKTCLVGIFSSQSNKIIQCREFAKEDLISWLSEPVVYGDPVIFGEEVSEEEFTKPPVSLFTSAGSTTYGARSAIQSPASINRPTTPSNYNRPRPPTNTATPSFRSSTAGPSRPSPGPTRPPNNSGQYQFKTPSTVVTTPRAAPYVQPNRSLPTVNSNSSPTAVANKEPVVDDKFLSQFLDGIDTDKIFDDLDF